MKKIICFLHRDSKLYRLWVNFILFPIHYFYCPQKVTSSKIWCKKEHAPGNKPSIHLSHMVTIDINITGCNAVGSIGEAAGDCSKYVDFF